MLYFALYIVTDPGSVRELSKMQTLTEKESVSYTHLRDSIQDEYPAADADAAADEPQYPVYRKR